MQQNHKGQRLSSFKLGVTGHRSVLGDVQGDDVGIGNNEHRTHQSANVANLACAKISEFDKVMSDHLLDRA